MAVEAMIPHNFCPIREHADVVTWDMKMWRVTGMQKKTKTQHTPLQSFTVDSDDKAGVVSDLCVIGLKDHTFNERNKESQTKQLNCGQTNEGGEQYVYKITRSRVSTEKSSVTHCDSCHQRQSFQHICSNSKPWWI